MPVQNIENFEIDFDIRTADTVEVEADVIIENAPTIDGEYTMPLLQEPPVITSISRNGEVLPIVDKNVDIEVPVKTSELDNDSNFVTSGELATVALSGSYNDLSDKPEIPSIEGLASETYVGNAVSEHNVANDSHNDIRMEVSLVKDIAEGANIAIVFDSYSELVTFFNSESDSLKVGTNLYIKTLEVPDLWVSSIETSSVTYTYTTDSDFLAYINNNGQIGYYKFSQLETQKVDLSNYATLTDLGGKVSKSGDTMTGDLNLTDSLIHTSKTTNVAGWTFGSGALESYFHIDRCNQDGVSNPRTILRLNGSTDYNAIFSTNVYINNTATEEGNRLIPKSELDSTIETIYKQGIVSQTQTWTQQTDGSYSYVMTNKVTGNISIAFIDKWNLLGSKYASQSYSHTFNESTGYFELNGLTDISYEEAMVIVEESQPFSMQGVVTKYARTNFAVLSAGVTITRFAQNSNIEVAYLAGASLNGTNANTNFNGSNYLKTILSMRSQYLVTSYTFANCPSLVTIDCYGSAAYSFKCNVTISGNKVLSIESLATMVRQRNGTDAFTITIDPAVYTRCQADTTEYTYSGNTYVGIIAYANARNITIQQASALSMQAPSE